VSHFEQTSSGRLGNARILSGFDLLAATRIFWFGLQVPSEGRVSTMTPISPMPPTYSQVVLCGVCKTQLSISAIRDDGPRTSTRLTISCPGCFKNAEVVVPLSIVVSSVQVIWYERPPADKVRARSHA
jgi:hypothetical protein